jgi:hypothetical protein
MAAIGSSDFHGWGRMGMCRTYVFARDDSAEAILEALRAHRTVVYGLEGRAYGDPSLVRLAAQHGRLGEGVESGGRVGRLDWLGRVCGVFGLLGLVVSGKRQPFPVGGAPAGEHAPA